MIALDEAGYVYPSGVSTGPVTLRIGPGERVVLAGPSGSGKTTLLRLLGGLHGRAGWGTTTGRVTLDHVDPATIPPAQRPQRLGWVAQDPADQIVTGTVADEIAFGPECAGWPPARVAARIAVILARVGLDVEPTRDPKTLSTGEQQRLVVGAALAGGARVLLLDEPLAHLDPDGAALLLARLTDVARDGVAVILAEHRLRAVGPWCDRVLRLEAGRLVGDGPYVPLPVIALPPRSRGIGPVVHRARLTWRYGDRLVLDDVEIALHAGERVALIGANGAGKSTLLGLLSGRLGTAPGTDVIEVPQDPDLTLFCATVRAELAYGPVDRRLPDPDISAVAEGLDLVPLLDRSPHALSRGQRQRTAVGAALTCRPRVLLLDEPTAGQDLPSVERMLEALDRTLGDGALLFATHDLELARRHATRTLRLDGGRLREVP